ncbi:hypothetical protein FA95DRAFT_1562455 [Auriscalpium vulgare]|uniref:Uncharacterized protein n=1 Tax=Auriscalpium vulgare TaxID=40419 RepID=A0ACB8RK30_9AGAM|nr:hypothetical protein FA95DRAFT_1562455 [Auriscalpium vulgare]
MASLLERMNIDSVGPTRSKPKRVAAAPYTKPPRGDVNGTWQHDLFPTAGGNTLAERLAQPAKGAPPKMNFGNAEKALREATGHAREGLSIRGASTRGNVVDVSGLVKGTTAEDVQAIFKRCGDIIKATVKSDAGEVVVRLTYKFDTDAKKAVDQFNNMVADGRTLTVKIVGGVDAGLSGRMGVSVINAGSVDALLEDNGGSKMRSDSLLADPEARLRAHVLVAPPGADPKDYTQSPRGGRGRGRGARRGGGRRGRPEGRMDVD